MLRERSGAWAAGVILSLEEMCSSPAISAGAMPVTGTDTLEIHVFRQKIDEPPAVWREG